MAKTKPASKVLRVGVIQAGKIVEERIIWRPGTVTVGCSVRNTIVVPVLPKSVTLFPCKGGRYLLRFTAGMDGRVSAGGQLRSLAQIHGQGQSQPRGPHHELPLDYQTRGKIKLGEVTILFQFVTPPPQRPQPQLPHYVRSSLWQAIDPVLACSLVVLAVANFSFVGYLRALDLPSPEQVTEQSIPWIPIPQKPVNLNPAVLARVGPAPVKVARVEPPKPKPRAPKTNARRGNKGKASRAARRSNKPACDKACVAARKRARLARLVRGHGVLRLLTHKGGKPGHVQDLLKNGNPGADLARAMPSGGVRVATRNDRFALQRQDTGGQPGKRTTIGDLSGRLTGPTEVKLRRVVKDRIPRVLLRKEPLKISDPQMNHDAAYWTIKRGMSCIQASYERTLKHNPVAQGKMAVCMQINQLGRVERTTTKLDTVGDATLARRVKVCMQRLKFPPPKKQSARVCVPFVLRRAAR